LFLHSKLPGELLLLSSLFWFFSRLVSCTRTLFSHSPAIFRRAPPPSAAAGCCSPPLAAPPPATRSSQPSDRRSTA
jgi:hypothetical protein